MLAGLLPRLKPVKLKAREELEISNQPVKRVFFIETGIAAVLSNKEGIALGLIGCEGASAVAAMLGDTRTPSSTVMLTEEPPFLRVPMNGQPLIFN
jgi:hypothetical protein